MVDPHRPRGHRMSTGQSTGSGLRTAVAGRAPAASSSYTRSHDVGGGSFEADPGRDSVPSGARYGMPRRWRVGSCVRGVLRLPGWYTAGSDVSAALAEHGLGVVDELARDLAARHPTTPARASDGTPV